MLDEDEPPSPEGCVGVLVVSVVAPPPADGEVSPEVTDELSAGASPLLSVEGSPADGVSFPPDDASPNVFDELSVCLSSPLVLFFS